MTDSSNPEYYAARAARALELADTATDPFIAQVHRRLAESYSELAEYAAGSRPPLRAVSG